MALHPSGLGKGLEALIRERHEEKESSGVQTLPLTSLIPNPSQPRRHFSEKALEELATSIKSQGLLQPLLVRPIGPAQPGKYEIVAGERRWRACQMAGLTEVPVLIKALSSQDTLAAALIENLQREDLNPLEEALGLQTLKEEFGLSQDDLAQKIGKSRSAIANSLRLLSLPESMRPLLVEGKITSGHARALLSITEPRAQEYMKNLILENVLSVREAEGLAAGWKENGSFELAGLTVDEESTALSLEKGQEKKSSGDTPPGRGMPQSARILEIQNKIGELFQIPVKVTGKETKGRISFSYSSKEELELLLERLSQSVLEGEVRTALPSKDHRAVGRQNKIELSGTEYPSLDSDAKERLEGAERVSLDSTVTQESASTDGSPDKQEPTGPAKEETLEDSASQTEDANAANASQIQDAQ